MVDMRGAKSALRHYTTMFIEIIASVCLTILRLVTELFTLVCGGGDRTCGPYDREVRVAYNGTHYRVAMNKTMTLTAMQQLVRNVCKINEGPSIVLQAKDQHSDFVLCNSDDLVYALSIPPSEAPVFLTARVEY